MERLTEKNKEDTSYYYPTCFNKCDGLGYSSKCDERDFAYKICERLGQLEDLDEQGRLLILPCVVGDVVYKVSPNHVYIDTCQITGFAECDSIKSMRYTVYIDPDEEDIIALSDFGKTVFLTQKEAEAALKELRTRERV